MRIMVLWFLRFVLLLLLLFVVLIVIALTTNQQWAFYVILFVLELLFGPSSPGNPL